MFLIRTAAIAIAIFVVTCNAPLEAREEKGQSTFAQIMFDITIDRLLQTPEFKEAALDNLVQFDSTESPFGAGFTIADITRISGAISMPNRVGDFARIFYEQEFPFDFMVQVQFAKESHVNKLNEYLVGQEFSTQKLRGASFTRIPLTDTQTSVLLGRTGPSSIVIGTKSFVSQKLNEVISPAARKVWFKNGKGPFRLVLDLERSRSLADEVFQLVDFGEAHDQLVKVCGQSDAFFLSLLPDSGELLQVGVCPVDGGADSKLRKRMDFLSFQLRSAINRTLKPFNEDRDAEPVSIDGVSTKVSSSVVKIVVTKPSFLTGMLRKAMDGAAEESESKETEERTPEQQLTKR